MAVVIIPNLGTVPLIDAISPTDYLLIGDQSDSGELKRVLIESLPNSSADKLAIANYSFNTIPDKPITYPNAPITWADLQGKPLVFPPNTHTHVIDNASILPVKLAQPYTQGSPFSLSGVSYDVIAIPSWVTEISIKIADLSTNGNSLPILQLGSNSGIETSGYKGNAIGLFSSFTQIISVTNGLVLDVYPEVDQKISGVISMELVSAVNNSWLIHYNGAGFSFNLPLMAISLKSLSAALDRIRFTTANGSSLFNSGLASISWQ